MRSRNGYAPFLNKAFASSYARAAYILIFIFTSIDILSPSTFFADSNFHEYDQASGDMKLTGRVYHTANGKVVVEAWPHPRKLNLKVNKITLVSPSGKTYRITDIESVPKSQLLKRRSKYLHRPSSWLKGLFQSYAYASCGTCGIDEETPATEKRRDDSAAQAGFGILMGMSEGAEKEWVSIAEFNVEEEPGQWRALVDIVDQKTQSHRFTVPFKLSDISMAPQESPTEPPGPTVPRGPEGPAISVPKGSVGVTPPTHIRLGIDITKCPNPWLPEKDNTVTFTAKIYKWVGGRGWVYPGLPRVITFTLSDVSKEKGICMNKGDETTPDLYFKSHIPGFSLSGGEGGFHDTARTLWPVTTATVTVTSDDYGSFGWIKSSAPGCEDIRPNGPVSIPLDDNTNTIADSAPQDDNGNPPENDKDSTPTLDGHDGDGYTNYEEYRGFFVQGTHTRTDITQKDLLINDQTGMGLGHYPESKITCHLVSNDELRDREGNFNRGHATTGAQHGLIMKMNAGGELSEGVAGQSVQIKFSQLGPPGNVSAVIFNTWTPRNAAHELGHSTCVWHHGNSSWAPIWIYALEDNPILNNPESSLERRTFQEAQGEPPWTLCGKTLPAQFRFHPKGTEQSGDVDCVMKYVGFFEIYSDFGMFECWPADADGTTFCSSPNGTGYNAGGLVGGNATEGNCRGQLRVNDK